MAMRFDLSLFGRLRAMFRKRADDREFADELDVHLALLVEDNLRRGMPADEAERAARVRLGNQSALREQHRDERSVPALDSLLQDLRFAIRVIVRGRGFSAAAILTLALGIGANAAGFTIMYAALLRTLPFEAADDLFVVSWNLTSGRRGNASLVELQEWQAQTRTFAGLAGYTSAMMNLSDDRDPPEQVQGTALTPTAFDVLRQRPLIGRDFVAADEQPGAEAVAIIGAKIWRSRYASDPDVLGRSLRVNGRTTTIVGVMPDGLAFPESTEIWTPFVPSASQRTRTARVLRVFGRVADRSTLGEARAELSGFAAQMRGPVRLDPLKLDPSSEGLDPEAAVGARGAAGGEHVVRAGRVVAAGDRRPRTDEDRARVPHAARELVGTGALEREMLGRDRIGHFERVVQ